MVELDKNSLISSLNEMENELRLYPIEDGLEEDIINFINGEELSDFDKLDLENRMEEFFYGAQLKCRSNAYFFKNGFEIYFTNLDLDLRKLVHVRDSFPKFNKLEVICDEDQGFNMLGVRLLL